MIDGEAVRMTERAAPATLPQRPTKSTVQNSKASSFPVRTCEASIPRGTHAASISGHSISLPKAHLDHIVVIGDTGCRIKAADNAAQGCNDPAAYPFARIAAQAAATHPDLVLHVGDYLYRENPCPAGNVGCAGSVWGYGWDAWNADFFAPAAPLLAAAPWIMVRGNHESCLRAGQGWWRFLAAQDFTIGRDCNDVANDARGDDSPPFAAPLGKGAQIIVMDLAIAGEDPISATDPRQGQLKAIQQTVMHLAKGHRFTFATDHYPILGLSASAKNGDFKLNAGNLALRSTFGVSDPAFALPGIDMLIAGHVHEWQHVDLGLRHPSQLISGMSGTQEDVVPIPPADALASHPARGVSIKCFDSWTDGFGFMTMDRTGSRSWRVEVHALDGTIVRRCRVHGRRSTCAD
tara:strand:+ start:531 stop:1748 length:1218 start_codon:yes stop_codon:yes gene_type:complete